MTEFEQHLADIADAIREKEGSTGAIPAAEFAARIRALTTGGYALRVFRYADITYRLSSQSAGTMLTITIPAEVSFAFGNLSLVSGSRSKSGAFWADGTNGSARLVVEGAVNYFPGAIGQCNEGREISALLPSGVYSAMDWAYIYTFARGGMV